MRRSAVVIAARAVEGSARDEAPRDPASGDLLWAESPMRRRPALAPARPDR
jgi:hypothetical protein